MSGKEINIIVAPKTKPISLKVCDVQGLKGADGKSAYQSAVENNLTNAPSEKEWLLELGDSGGFVAEDFLSIYNINKG